MAEKTPNQQLAEKLLFKPAYVGDKSAAVKQEAHAFAEGYKKFLDAGKTEREVAAESEQMLKDAGYQQFDPKKTYAPGDKVYFSQLGKAIVASTIGTRSFEDGFHLVIAHTDSPRLDLRPTPLYESDHFSYFKTHYYGGIRKYQWGTMPLAIHGVFSRAVSNLERKMIYQAITFFARLIFLTYASATGHFLANLYDLVIERKDNLPYCMYYYVVFDHGLTKMAMLLNQFLLSENIDQGSMLMVKDCINALVLHSLDMGTETKASWEKTADECGADIWKEVAFLLRSMKGRRGNKKQVMTIDDLIVGNKAEVKQCIMEFLETNTEDICLAYLLVVLVKTEHIKSSVKYMTFHRAIEQLTQRHYGYDVPQKRYGEMKEFNFKCSMQSASYKKAKKIIDRWTICFEECK